MTQSSWGYRPALDGIRAVAVYLVVLFHARMSSATGGFIGVDLFFVLSGYLVTNVILTEVERSGTVRLRRFYARRIRRLLPASVVVIVAIACMWVLVAPLAERIGLVDDARSALLYYANWHFLAQAQDYFAAAGAESPYVHFWSLAIEEQFYFFYPLVVIGLFRLRNRVAKARRALVVPAGITVLFVSSLVLQLIWAQVNETHAYYGTDARLYQLLAGCLLAVVFRRITTMWAAGEALAVAGLGGLLLFGSNAVDMSPSNRGVVAMLCSVALIAGLERSSRNWLGRVFARPLPVYLGRISYGTYLWHWPIVLVLGRLFDVPPWVLAVMTIVVATGLAALSAAVLEMPIRSAKVLDPIPRTVVAAGLSCSVLVAVLIPNILEMDRKPAIAEGGLAAPAGEEGNGQEGRGLSADKLDKALRKTLEASGVPAGRDGSTDLQTLEQIVETAKGPVPGGIDYEKLAKDAPDEVLCDASSPQDCTLVSGSGPSILLVGDSTARTLLPALTTLAEERDLTFTANVTGACGFTLATERTDRQDDADCRAARDGWYETAIPILEPDLVIVQQRSMTGGNWDKKLRAVDPEIDALPLPERQAELGRQTLRTLEGLGAPVVVLDPAVSPMEWSNADCLSAADTVAECAFEAPKPEPVEDAYREEDERSERIAAVSLDPILCPLLPVCIPYIDDQVVWRDDVHVLTTFWTSHRDQLWELLEGTGLLPG